VRLIAEGSAPGAPALVLPGRGYDADQPVLRIVRDELLVADRRVLTLFWDETPPAPERVNELVHVLLHDLRPSFVVAKSLTTLGLPAAADCDLAGIWLTPLLDQPDVGMAAARSHEHTLLVGGTADESWDRTLAHESDREVLEFVGADHSLEFAGDTGATEDARRELRRRVREFLAS